MISVSSDEKVAEAGAFAKQTKATFPVVHDPKGVLFRKFGVSPIPANVIIDRKGRVVAALEGMELMRLYTTVHRAVGAK